MEKDKVRIDFVIKNLYFIIATIYDEIQDEYKKKNSKNAERYKADAMMSEGKINGLNFAYSLIQEFADSLRGKFLNFAEQDMAMGIMDTDYHTIDKSKRATFEDFCKLYDAYEKYMEEHPKKEDDENKK